MYARPDAADSTAVVPHPQNGSRIVSPGSLNNAMAVAGMSGMNLAGQGCSPWVRPRRVEFGNDQSTLARAANGPSLSLRGGVRPTSDVTQMSGCSLTAAMVGPLPDGLGLLRAADRLRGSVAQRAAVTARW